MGLFLEDEVARRFPGFETRRGLVSWEHYLPPLSPELHALVERYPAAAEDGAAQPAAAEVTPR
jgi:hypothetical protein